MAELPNCMGDCPFREWFEGYRSWGDDIPPMAQGAYFPGDEPGHICTHPERDDDRCGEFGVGTTYDNCPRFHQLPSCEVCLTNPEDDPCGGKLFVDTYTCDLYCEEQGNIS